MAKKWIERLISSQIFAFSGTCLTLYCTSFLEFSLFLPLCEEPCKNCLESYLVSDRKLSIRPRSGPHPKVKSLVLTSTFFHSTELDPVQEISTLVAQKPVATTTLLLTCNTQTDIDWHSYIHTRQSPSAWYTGLVCRAFSSLSAMSSPIHKICSVSGLLSPDLMMSDPERFNRQNKLI